ncbi:24660_t:CDS:2 [Gigaspora rosea]|nr:24660_t:CDS:2 [Gigaspora rosea]
MSSRVETDNALLFDKVSMLSKLEAIRARSSFDFGIKLSIR